MAMEIVIIEELHELHAFVKEITTKISYSIVKMLKELP